MISVCTIIAGNYLAHARVLADSFFAQHPEGSFTVLIVDDEPRALDRRQLDDLDHRVTWRRLDDLGLDRREIHRLAGIYDVTELSTAVKPLLLTRLLQERASAVIYLDPDIRIYDSLACLARLAERHGLVLTPHVTEPIPDDGRQVDALFVLAAGVYNLGFVAVAPSSLDCLDWWWQQTRRRALNDVSQMMFVDQRWADYMPSLFNPHLLKDPGCNVAYWNLHTRPITAVDGRLFARDGPLRFFHFSGFDPRTPWLLSRHQGNRPRILLSEQPALAALCDDYGVALDRAGFAARYPRAYGWRRSADGLEMTSRIRRLYWSALIDAERQEAPEPPDPFDAAQPEAFTAWLNAPGERGPRRWSRFLQATYQARPDVQARVGDLSGPHAAWFAEWLRHDGAQQEQIPQVLLPPEVPPETIASDEDERVPLPQGLNISGYFRAELGIGEAARLLTRAVDATGSAYATLTQQPPLSRQHQLFEERLAAAAVPFDVNLLCLNADATPAFAREAGPAFFANRYTIGYWFWEVDPLPSAMHGAFDHVDEVWAASDYVAQICRAAGRKPVFTVPLPLLAPVVSSTLTRDTLGLPADRFVFLFVFDFLSVIERKNPLGAIEAFCAAFAPGEGPVLVLKSINGHCCVPQLERVRRAAAHRPDILIRDGYVSTEEKNALLASCDCYVSLHRAEGLGLTLAEAMALGKPAIATGYSGNRHFMSDDNSFLVDFTVTAASGDCGPYAAGARWAEPDLTHAARLMRAVYEHPCEAARRAARARADLLFQHGVMPSASAISRRLACIRDERAAAAAPAAAAMAIEPVAVVPIVAEPVAIEPLVAEPLVAAPAAAEPVPRSAALDVFEAAVPELRLLGHPRLSADGRAWSMLRRAAQRAMFRIIRPYWYQQRQFQDALLEAVHASLERLATDGGPSSRATAYPSEPLQPLEPGRTSRQS